MTTVGPATLPNQVAPRTTAPPHFVEWSAVFAGAVLAAAISFVLLTFGTAIGLSATSPWPGSGASAKVVASLAIFWAMVQHIGAFMAGGYVAGRMRARWADGSEHESDFRDGLHGGLVWGLGVVIGAALLVAAGGAAATTGAQVAGQAAGSVASMSNETMDTVLDAMLRGTSAQQAATPAAGTDANTAAGQPGTTANRARTGTAEEQRSEMSRLLMSSIATGGLSDQNRTYLAQLVAQRTGLPQPEAERRVNDAIAQARDAADKARRTAVLTGFVTAASLVISLAAAWWAAVKGGNHRDNQIPARFAVNTTRRITPST